MTYGNAVVVKYLTEFGAGINRENSDGKTPLFYACKSENENRIK